MIAVTSKEEKKRKLLAGSISLGISGLIFLFLLLYKIIIPNPPFELLGQGGIEFNFGNYNEGTGEIENSGIGDATDVIASAATPTASAATESVYTSDEGENINLEKKEDRPKIEENKTVITVKPNNTNSSKDNKNTNSLLNAAYTNSGKTSGGGDGNSGDDGNDGRPDGNITTHGLGGTGGDTDAGSGLGGRKIIVPPCPAIDNKEEGTVVVTFKVDKQGNVISADPNGPGTNTSSAILKSKAKHAVECIKLSPSDKDVQVFNYKITFKY